MIRGSLILLLLGLGYLAYEIWSIPFNTIPLLQDENPGMTTFMQQQIRERLPKNHHIQVFRQWTPLSEVSAPTLNAIIAAKDAIFLPTRI